MILAAIGLVAALFVMLSGNAAKLTELVVQRHRAGRAVVASALVGEIVMTDLLALAGVAFAPVVGHEIARILAASVLTLTIGLVLRPQHFLAPKEPTRSLAAVAAVAAAFSLRDGLGPLAFALGLFAEDIAGAVAGLAMGTVVAALLATRGGASRLGEASRYMAAIMLAVSGFYVGALAP